MKFGLDFAEHDVVYVEASLQTLCLRREASSSLIAPAEVEALIQVDLKFTGLKLSLQA